ncbi:GTPase [Stella sp.]|uniref:GTPase n=1 Tax=Stella sp. TaxID=2912054 RepID=UPI0035B16453
MVATLRADIDRATGEGDLTGLFAFARDADLKPLADLLRRVAPEALADDPRVARAPDRPSRWPDRLADAVDRVAATALRGFLGIGDRDHAAALADSARRLGVAIAAGTPPLAVEQAILAHFGLGGDVAADAAVPAEVVAAGNLAAVVFRVAALRARSRTRLGLDPFGVARPPPEAGADPAVAAIAASVRGRRLRGWDALIDRLTGSSERLAFARLAPCNVLVCGKSGVGKSTLVNAVFGRDLARTGIGDPVTERAQWYGEEGFPVRLLDTRGLEPGDYAGSRAALEAAILAARRDPAAKRQLHLAWLCIDNGAGRIEEADRATARMLADQGVPTVLVLTKGWEDRGMEALAAERLPGLPVVRVVAQPRRFASGATVPAAGLARLVEESERRVPDGHRSAFAAAQSVALEPKVRAARRVIDGATASAATLAATPIPFVGWAALAPVMIGMIAGISRAAGVAVAEDRLGGVAVAIVGALAAGLGVRSLAAFAGNLAKLVPGVGTLVGGAITAAVAGAMTKAAGEAYLDYLLGHIRRHGQWPTADEIVEFLRARWLPF